MNTSRLVTPLTVTAALIVAGSGAAWQAYGYLDSMRREEAEAREVGMAQLAAKFEEKADQVAAQVDGIADSVAAQVDGIGDQVSALKSSGELGSIAVTNKLERIDDAIRRQDESGVRVPDLRIWIQAAKSKYPELPDFPIR